MATKTVLGNVVTAVTNNIAKIKTAIGNATTSAAGLMSSTDKTKLDGVEASANKTTIVNNLTATTAGSALDATQGKALSDKITSLNDSLANKQNLIVIQSGYWGSSGTAMITPTQKSNNLYVIDYTVPSVSGYTFLFAVPQIGWANDHINPDATIVKTILTSQTGQCELYIGTVRQMNLFFTAFYVKN